MRPLIVLIALVIGATAGQAQGVAGRNISLDVGISEVAMRGDTTQVTYVLKNSPASAEPLFQFVVDVPATVVRVISPSPAAQWFVFKGYRGRSVAGWASLGRRMSPGQQTPSLPFEAIGLPTISTTRFQGWFPPDTIIPADTLPAKDDLVLHGLVDSTVSVEPLPADLGAANLLNRLEGLRSLACGSSLAWITSSSVCTSLGAQLDSASQSVGQGNMSQAHGHVTNFLGTVSTQHGTGLPINDSAYWLLKVNAEFIAARLQ